MDKSPKAWSSAASAARAHQPPAAASLAVDILVEAGPWNCANAIDAAIREAAQRAYDRSGRGGDGATQVVVVLSDDAAVQALNRQFRGQDKPTNVLSFPAADAVLGAPARSRHLGDIVLGYETVLRECEEQSVTLHDHVRHLVVHGVLHLMGFDHATDADAEQMEALEIRVLASLGVADPYSEL